MPDNTLLLAAFAWVQALSLPAVAALAVGLALGLIIVITRCNWRVPLRPALGTGLVLGAAWIAYGLLVAAQIEADAAVPQRPPAKPPAHAAAKTQLEPAMLAVVSPAR